MIIMRITTTKIVMSIFSHNNAWISLDGILKNTITASLFQCLSWASPHVVRTDVNVMESAGRQISNIKTMKTSQTRHEMISNATTTLSTCSTRHGTRAMIKRWIFEPAALFDTNFHSSHMDFCLTSYNLWITKIKWHIHSSAASIPGVHTNGFCCSIFSHFLATSLRLNHEQDT